VEARQWRPEGVHEDAPHAALLEIPPRQPCTSAQAQTESTGGEHKGRVQGESTREVSTRGRLTRKGVG